MIGFGWTNPFPIELGGGDSDYEVEVGALVKQYMAKIAISDAEDTESYAEALGEATALSIIWSCNERLRNQGIPTRMLENLAVWEEATGLRPSRHDSEIDRRNDLAGKMRGQTNNALGDISDVALKILGSNFVALLKVDPVNHVVYWPGINPGPPGYEWSSNRAHVAIKMTETGLTPDESQRVRSKLSRQMHALLPAWMTFSVGVGDSFTVGSATVGKTLL